MRAFISYSHNDARVLDRLHTHLAMLKRDGKITAWYDRDILAGGEFDEEISTELTRCELFLALVSPDFLASTYCYEKEMETAIRRHEAGEIRLVPIIVEPCDWKASPLKKFKVTPRDGKPVSEWTNENNAFVDIVTELRRIVDAAVRPKAEKAAVASAETSRAEARRYRVKRDFDEIDKTDFRRASFEVIRSYFGQAVAEINGIDDIRASFDVIGPQSFTCTVINKARQRGIAHLTVHSRSGRDGLGDIFFAHQENAPTNTANGWLSIDNDEYDLFLKGSLGFDTNEKRLTAQQVAEHMWADLLERAGISHA